MQHSGARSGRTILLLIVTASALAGCCPDTRYEILVPDPTVRLPLDESPHCSGGEWWYYSGEVVTDEARGYGIQAVIFHVPLGRKDAWVAHFSVLDEASGVFAYDHSRSVDQAARGALASDGFDLSTALLQMTGAAGQDHLRGAMADGAYAVDLILQDARGAVLHGEEGYAPYGADGRSFYYSRPRMQAQGTLEINGEPHAVSGILWFDRQWGRDLKDPRLPWDWFSLRLDDGADVMLYAFRDTNPAVAFGTYIPATGDPMPLAREDFITTPTAWWTSPHTGIAYPVGWEISIVPQQLSLTVTAVADNQEFDARSTTLNVYWEGLCTVTGTRAGQPVVGRAYVELTNYGR
jgi:predicted secreted hydrolase